jgi:hypothetical protein
MRKIADAARKNQLLKSKNAENNWMFFLIMYVMYF